MRGTAFLTLLVLSIAAIARAFAGGAPAPEAYITDITRPAAETCGACHADVYAEWDPGLHHRSWTNDNILRMTERFSKLECRPCHSPMPVLPAGLEKAEGEVSPWPHEPPSKWRGPAFRPERVEEGVHCLSCHSLGEGQGVAALHDVPDAPCRPRKDERLASVALCAACHDPTHQAEQEYRVGPAPGRGETCMDCHMAEVERAGGRAGHSHVFPGGFDRSQVPDGVHADAALEAGALVVRLQNRTGHKFPGEIPSRSLTIDVAAFDAGGKQLLDASELLRRSFKNLEERDRVDNRLKPGETRELRWPLPAGAARATVSVNFLSLPLQPKRHWIPILDRSLEVR